MAEKERLTDVAKKFAAAAEGAQPRLRGRLISESGGSTVIKAADAILEVQEQHIAQRTGRGDEIELILTPDAEILVSTVVSVERGFIGDNVFGALVPSVVAANCNCNCNCDTLQGTGSVIEASRLRRPFTGGRRPNVSV